VYSQPPERPLEKLLRQLHVLLDIRLEMPRSCLPVVCRVADAGGEEGKLAGTGPVAICESLLEQCLELAQGFHDHVE
jgi:hypothetical protein